MTELLAPAGNLTSLKAAIASGADAVYLGLSAFNARIKADNFTEENIAETVKYCHVFGVKAYITVNISVKNDELSAVESLITACKNADADAFIVTDLAVVDIIKNIAPHIPMHASTQMGICNLAAAKYAESLGFSRVVLAREATLNEIRAIKNNTSLEIEYFVHGALCVAFSGKCLLSSVTNGGSGNRGRCLQPCRLHYTEKYTNNSGYLLSTSDLCLIDKLRELKEAGVDSYKIEGRLRRPEYVYNTVKTYRKVIDNGFVATNDDFYTLKAAYNRGGFTRGYAYDDTKSIMSVGAQGNLGIFVGSVKSIKNGLIKLDKNYEFSIGEGFKLFNQNGLEVGGGRIDKIIDGCAEIKDAKVGYRVNITSSNFSFSEKKLKVDTFYNLNKNGVLSLTYSSNGVSVTVTDNPYFIAERKPLDIETLNSALTKFGNEVFVKNKCEGIIDGDFFAPRSTLNALRRKGLEKLTDEIINKSKRPITIQKYESSIIKKPLNEIGLVAVELQNINQLSDELKNLSDIIVYYPDEFTLKSAKEFLLAAKDCSVFIKLTPNGREDDCALFDTLLYLDFDGVYADNYYAVTLAKKHGLKIFAGQGLNVFNNKTLEILQPDFYMASAELSTVELKKFNSPFVYSYGKLPLMNFSHCVYKLNTKGNCDNCKYNKKLTYVDDKNYAFDIVRNKAARCYFTLYNSKITDISAKFINRGFNYYLNMLQCDCKNAAVVARAFHDDLPLNTPDCTNGYIKRGIE